MLSRGEFGIVVSRIMTYCFISVETSHVALIYYKTRSFEGFEGNWSTGLVAKNISTHLHTRHFFFFTKNTWYWSQAPVINELQNNQRVTK